MDWQKLVDEDPTLAVAKVREFVRSGNVVEASDGILAIVEAMGKSELRDLKSQAKNILMHMYKIWLMPQSRAVRHWQHEIETFRNELEEVIDSEPGMKQKIPEAFEKTKEMAKRHAYHKLGIQPTGDDNLPDFSFDDVLSACDLDKLVLDALENKANPKSKQAKP